MEKSVYLVKAVAFDLKLAVLYRGVSKNLKKNEKSPPGLIEHNFFSIMPILFKFWNMNYNRLKI